MKKYIEFSKDELNKELETLSEEYKEYASLNLKLNMARGKPCKEQLDLSMGMLDVVNSESSYLTEDGTDCRNYGLFDGIYECKKLLGDMMDVPPENVVIYGNSSLNIMYECIARSMIHGVLGSTPWTKLEKVKFICLVPGYDRHFAVSESFGIESIPVPLGSDGPDMDLIEELVSNDESIKGVWCVPIYSNPSGITYSDEVVRRFANLKPKAKDFRIYWDCAYIAHHFYEEHDSLLDLLGECEKAGNPNLVYKFVSTSKVSFAGAGISAIGASKENIEEIKKFLKLQTIGYDKINQLRHVLFFKDYEGIKEHMKKHEEILRPKFELVDKIFTEGLEGLGIASWTKPRGGYFISFDTLEGCAKKVYQKCKDIGVELTPAGSAFPHKIDLKDTNIRIAPSFPPLKDLEIAAKVFVLCVKMVSIEKILENK